VDAAPFGRSEAGGPEVSAFVLDNGLDVPDHVRGDRRPVIGHHHHVEPVVEHEGGDLRAARLGGKARRAEEPPHKESGMHLYRKAIAPLGPQRGLNHAGRVDAAPFGRSEAGGPEALSVPKNPGIVP
jgi:hypothetical protein